MNQEHAPYVVSADVSRLMRTWAAKNRYRVPNEAYFSGMLRDLESVLNSYFHSVQVVPERYLVAGLSGMADRSPIPIISLDRAYIDDSLANLAGYIDITRTVGENLESNGLSERPGSLPIETQVDLLSNSLDTDRVALLDDVLFEGGTHTTIAEWLRKKGIIVEQVLVGVSIKEGEEKLAREGIGVQSLLSYGAVVDEICERDFIAAVPMSGRTVVTATGEVFGAPYFSPFGKPEKWASIPPEYAQVFSDFCLAQSIMLWQKIERMSKSSIATHEVPKAVFGLEPSHSIVTSLRRVSTRN